MDSDTIDKGSHRTGMLPLSAQEIRELRKHQIVKVRPNRLAIERKNKELRAKGGPLLDSSAAVSDQEEISATVDPTGEGSGGAMTSPTAEGGAPTAVVSAAVDNSKLPAFPPIGNQGGENSCIAWTTTYYQMSHATCLARGCDNKSSLATRFSPRLTYNMINGGYDDGSSLSAAFRVLSQNGGVGLDSLPYSAGDYRQWPRSAAIWQKAIGFRANPVQLIYMPTTPSATGLDQVKQLLANGHVLGVGTYIYSWVLGTVGNDPSEPSPYAGQHAARYMNGKSGGHGMTLVGYDDSVWIDVNGNGAVDSGEKGAFKVANSWGTGWKNSGFIWLAYDAIYAQSAVANAPTSRYPVFQNGPNAAYYLSAKAAYSPTLLAQFTVNSATRGSVSLRTGTSATSSTSPTSIFTSGAFQNQGGPFGFDGSSAAVDGTFVLDLSDLASSSSTLNYYLSASNSGSGALGINDFRLINLVLGTQVAATGLPTSLASGTKNIAISHNMSGAKSPPVAVISASSTPTSAGLSVDFSGLGSSDPNSGGSITSYLWSFGDGSLQQTGATVNHLYTTAGTFTVTLTVTNSFGLSGSTTYKVTVQDTTTPPPAVMAITAITPNQVKAGLSVVVTISGAGYLPGAKLSFSGAAGPAPTALVQSIASDGTTITAKFSTKTNKKGGAASRIFNVTVTNANGQSVTKSGGFTVTP